MKIKNTSFLLNFFDDYYKRILNLLNNLKYIKNTSYFYQNT